MQNRAKRVFRMSRVSGWFEIIDLAFRVQVALNELITEAVDAVGTHFRGPSGMQASLSGAEQRCRRNAYERFCPEEIALREWYRGER